MRVAGEYSSRSFGWNIQYYHSRYRHEGGTHSYSRIRSQPQEQEAGPVMKIAGKGRASEATRARSARPGMMIYQDGSTHEWVVGQNWDLIVTMDGATNERYLMFSVDEEGTQSSLRGVGEVIEQRGLFASFYSDGAVTTGTHRRRAVRLTSRISLNLGKRYSVQEESR